MDCNASGFNLHYKDYKGASFFLFFCNSDVEKSQILFLPMDQNANLAESHLCPVPTRKSCQDSCCRVRQIHKSVPPSLLPFPCSVLHYFSGSLLLCVESQETFLCIALLIYLNSHLVPLGSFGLLGRSFMRPGFPWSIRSCFPGVDGGPVSPLQPILLCSGKGRSQFPAENYFSHIQERCVRKMASQ